MLTMMKPMDDCETVTIKQQAMIEAIWQKNVKDVLLVGRTFIQNDGLLYMPYELNLHLPNKKPPSGRFPGPWKMGDVSGSASTSMNGWLMCTHACTRSRRVSWLLIAVQCFGDIETGPIRCLGRERSSLSMFCLGKSWGLSFQGFDWFRNVVFQTFQFPTILQKKRIQLIWKLLSNFVFPVWRLPASSQMLPYLRKQLEYW